MTTKVEPSKPLTESCKDEACDYLAVAAVWTTHQANGTTRTTVQWDLTDPSVPLARADKFCNLHTMRLLSNLGKTLMPKDL